MERLLAGFWTSPLKAKQSYGVPLPGVHGQSERSGVLMFRKVLLSHIVAFQITALFETLRALGDQVMIDDDQNEDGDEDGQHGLFLLC